jgi:ABC-type lipoprotein export system ATPase subunit
MNREAMTETIIFARDLTRIYPLGANEVIGLNHVDLMVPAGEFVVLKGASGSGKSTLLSLVAGLDAATHGQLQVAGRDLQRLTEMQKTTFRREVVGMIFQSFNLLPTLSVEENVCLPALLAGAPLPAATRRASQLLDWLGMSARCRHRPAQLSGGEMQRTAIARALINEPPLILADEPTGNLDSRNGDMVIERLRDLNRLQGHTVVMATHSDKADPYATRFIHLRDGAIQLDQGRA